MDQAPDSPETQAPLMAQIIDLETLRRHRRLVEAREWLRAQLPWQRTDARRISDRIRAA